MKIKREEYERLRRIAKTRMEVRDLEDNIVMNLSMEQFWSFARTPDGLTEWLVRPVQLHVYEVTND
jgi:hypothetical protein